MSLGLLATALLFSPLTGAFTAIVMLSAVLLYITSLLSTSEGSVHLWICCAVLSWPLSFALLFALLQEHVSAQAPFALIAFLTSGLLVLESGVMMDVLTLASSGGITPLFALLKLISQVVFGAGLAAGCLMLAELAFELPVAWLMRASRERFSMPLAGIRLVLILILVSMSLNFIVDLFQSEIVPG